MRRRRVLALGAAAVGFGGCIEDGTEGAVPPSTRTGDRRPTTSGVTQTRTPTPTPSIGGSLHGRPYRIADDVGLVERSDTDWIHAFFDVRRKYESDVPPEEDQDVAALRRVARETGVNLFVTLQWNFIGIFGEQPPTNVPSPGSDRERALFEYATELLDAIDRPVDVVALGNEPVWETLDDDILGRRAPLVTFTRRLKEHLVDSYVADDTRLLVGAFNRFYDSVWDDYQRFFRRLLAVAREDDVDGIDLHVHYYYREQAETMLEVARREFPDGLVTASEFSPVFRYFANVDRPIGESDEGARFAERYGVAADTTTTEYLEAAKDDRLSPREVGDFYDAMPWYNVDFVEDMYALLDRYDVEVGTFGFLVADDVHNVVWDEDWSPFPINCLFQPALIDAEDGAHPHYLDDFREMA